MQTNNFRKLIFFILSFTKFILSMRKTSSTKYVCIVTILVFSGSFLKNKMHTNSLKRAAKNSFSFFPTQCHFIILSLVVTGARFCDAIWDSSWFVTLKEIKTFYAVVCHLNLGDCQQLFVGRKFLEVLLSTVGCSLLKRLALESRVLANYHLVSNISSLLLRQWWWTSFIEP